MNKCNKEQKAKIALYVIFILFFFSFSFAKSYSNPSANITYILNKDGSIYIHEEIVYDIVCSSFDCYHELYVWHPSNVNIKPHAGRCLETICRFITYYSDGKHWMILRKDEGFKTGRYTAVFDYKVYSEILEQKDTAQFFYKVWYDQWEKGISDLRITIYLPSYSNDVVYFIHPNTSSISTKIELNKIEINSVNHPPNQYVEINLLMPKKWFSNLTKADNYMTKDEIIRGELSSSTSDVFWYFIKILIGVLPIIVFVILYFLYGREIDYPELKTLPVYIRDISEIDENITPSEAALLLKGAFSSNIDTQVLSNGIAAELLELYRLGYLDIVEEKEESLLGTKKELYLIPNQNKDVSKLSTIQQILLKFIISNLKDGKFNTKDLIPPPSGVGTINFDLSVPYKYHAFVFEGIRGELQKSGKKYVDDRGLQLINVFCGTYIVFLMFLFSASLSYEWMQYSFLGIITTIIILIFVNLKPFVMNRWKKEGRIKHEMMKNYKKFLEDFTLLKEKMPKDVVLWEKALVYATAFGISEKVVNAFNVAMPDHAKQSRFIAFGSGLTLSHYINRGISATTSPRGGFGSGRGRGGGGGGAR